jgi:hypothetical protein
MNRREESHAENDAKLNTIDILWKEPVCVFACWKPEAITNGQSHGADQRGAPPGGTG